MIKKTLQKIFKTISYSLFFKIYGKIYKSINCEEDNRIEVKKIHLDNNLNYKVYKIKNGRIYTDRIHDTAIILDNKIVNEPSFQYRQTHDLKIFNSKVENNIVFKKGTPRKLRNLNGSVLSLLTGGAGNNNYWHWLFDVLPRFGLCEKSKKLKHIDYFLLPSISENFQRESLDCLNIYETKRISSEKFRHIKAKQLIVTDHPVMISGNATRDIQNVPGWICKWLKKNLLNKSITTGTKTKNKIYIDRNIENSKYQPQRRIINEEEIKEYLKKNNFIIAKLHQMNFVDQMRLFYNAKCVVGLHGGGFGNVVFCKPKTKIVELKNISSANAIKNLSLKNNLNYISIAAKGKKIYDFKYPNQQGSIYIPINRIKKAIEK